jgi:hypothetical protein
MMRTRKERKKKNPCTPPSQKGKILDPSWVHVEPFIGYIGLLFIRDQDPLLIFHPIHMHIQPTMIIDDITLSLLAKMYVVF